MKAIRMFMVLLLVGGIFNLVEPAAGSAVLIDSGTSSHFFCGQPYLIKWETYSYDKNSIKVFGRTYTNVRGKWYDMGKWRLLLEKISKTEIKRTAFPLEMFPLVHFEKTKLSVNEYYWKIIRPEIGSCFLPPF